MLIALCIAPLLTGCAAVAPSADGANVSKAISECTGATVIVEFGVLDEPAIESCVTLTASIPALDILDSAGVKLTGTGDYGNAIVCRVNNRPAEDEFLAIDGYPPYSESCASMPPEFAYWALWVKQGGADWSYAIVGVSDLTLSAGDSIGLVFTTGLSTPTPN